MSDAILVFLISSIGCFLLKLPSHSMKFPDLSPKEIFMTCLCDSIPWWISFAFLMSIIEMLSKIIKLLGSMQ